MANQDLLFDISKADLNQINQQVIIGRVGDGGLKAVTVTVISNGTPYDLTGKDVVFEGLKADGTHIIDKDGGVVLNAQGGIFRYVFPYQAFTALGNYEQAFFKVVRGNQTDTTLEFQIKVLENKVEMGINSTSFISDFEKLKQELKQAYDDFLEKIKSDQDATQNIIDSTKATIQTLQEQLNTLNTKIQNSDIVTTGQYNNDMKTLNDQISQFNSTVDNIQKTVDSDLAEMKQKVDTAVADKMDKKPVVLANVQDIISTGVYWYDTNTKNLPPKLNSDNANGFIFAVFNDQDNGMVTIQGSDWHIEKYQGAFRNWVSNSPVLLFSGTARSGDTIKLGTGINVFSYLLFEIRFKTDYYHTTVQRKVPTDTVFYINNAGLKSNGKGMYQDEIRLKYTDNQTLSVLECLSLDTEKMEISNPDMYITAIKGVFQLQIVLNEKNEVVAYALVGELDKAIEVSDEFATVDFISNPFKYKLSNGALAVNEDYKEPIIEDDTNDISPLEQAQKQIVDLVQANVKNEQEKKQMQEQIINLTQTVVQLQKGAN